MPKNFFSIIIPTLNEQDNLPILLNSIKNQNYNDYEVIIADSLSQDQTKKIALSFKKKIGHFRFFKNKFKSVGAARNFGAQMARGQFLIFFDADVEIEKEFLKRINEKINQYHLDVLTVWNRAKKGWRGKIIFSLLNFSMTLFQKIKPSANGPCIIVKKTLFEKVKGFDETIIFGEDFDLIQRLWKIGAKFKVFSQPILYVSTRRFEKEGLLLSLYKSIKAILYQLFFGPIKKPIFQYQMGGKYYRE